MMLVRMAPMDEDIGAIESIGEKFLISFDNQLGLHYAIRVGHHPIF